MSQSGFQEQYRRFFYSDIQAFVWRTTLGWMVTASVLAFLLLCSLTLLFLPEGQIALVIFATPLALLLLAHLIKGPSCVFEIVTPLTRHRIPALDRLKAAKKFMERITPKILESQAGFNVPVQVSAATEPTPSTSTEPSVE